MMWDRSSPIRGNVTADAKNMWSARYRVRARSDAGFQCSPFGTDLRDVAIPNVAIEDVIEEGHQNHDRKMSTSRSCEALKYAVSALTRLDDFACEALGSGYFSQVYKVTHRVTNKVMVLKMNTCLSNRPNMLREVQLMNRLTHPNILKFMGVCVHEGQLHALTEFINDGSLEELLANTEMELSWITRIAISLDIARGMEYLHSRGVFHRDLTSKNIFIRKENGPDDTTIYSAIVGDFGLAAKIPDPLDTNRLSIVGSPYWMAPEVLKEKLYNEIADVFSYGIILCEITARISADPDILPRTENFGLDYVAFSEMIDYCPLDFLQFVFRCCQVDPDNRPSFEDIVPIIEGLQEKLTDSLSDTCDEHGSNYIKKKKHKRSLSADNILDSDESFHSSYHEEIPVTPLCIGKTMSEKDPFYSPKKNNPFASISRFSGGRKQFGTPKDPNSLSYDLPSPSYPFTPPCTPISPDSTHSSGKGRVSRSLPSSPVLLRKAAEQLHLERLRGSGTHKLSTPSSGYRLTPTVLKSKSDIFMNNGPIQRLCFDTLDDKLSTISAHNQTAQNHNQTYLSNLNNNNTRTYVTSTYISPKSVDCANDSSFTVPNAIPNKSLETLMGRLSELSDKSSEMQDKSPEINKSSEINDNSLSNMCETCSSSTTESYMSVDDCVLSDDGMLSSTNV